MKLFPFRIVYFIHFETVIVVYLYVVLKRRLIILKSFQKAFEEEFLRASYSV